MLMFRRERGRMALSSKLEIELTIVYMPVSDPFLIYTDLLSFSEKGAVESSQ